MSTSTHEAGSSALAIHVRTTRDSLAVDLSDGRTVIVPLSWFPRLLHATAQERGDWRLIAGGEGIHWNVLDEDISVEGLLAGRPSGESQRSFERWVAVRRSQKTTTRAGRSTRVPPTAQADSSVRRASARR